MREWTESDIRGDAGFAAMERECAASGVTVMFEDAGGCLGCFVEAYLPDGTRVGPDGVVLKQGTPSGSTPAEQAADYLRLTLPLMKKRLGR